MKLSIKSKFSSLFLFAISFFLISNTTFSQNATTQQKLETFLNIAEDLFEKAQLPGVGMAIVQDGKVLYKGGFGYSDLASKKPITENSLFFLGSTTKAFTGVVAAKLVDENKLAWKKPIINYIKDFTLSEPYVAKNIHLEDLFTHMSGLSRQDDLWLGKPLTRAQVYQQATKLPFAHSFRETWDYNNHAYVIIGKTLETVSGQTWESLIEENIFKPLEMSNSYTTHNGFMKDSNHVTGYQKDGKTMMPHNNSDNIGPAGALSSTPNDISKWLLMLVNKGLYKDKRIISEKEYDYLMNPKGMSFTDTCRVRYYSIGWGGKRTYGKRTLIHNGAIAGNNARILFSPDEGFGIFIMTNQISDYKDILTDYAEAIFINNDFKKDSTREDKLISFNRFIQFQNLLLDVGIEAAKTYYNTLSYKNFEKELDHLGHALLDANYIAHALFVFELNSKDHPTSYTALNSYAKALAKNNDTEKAIEIYKRSLQLNSENTNSAKEALEKLMKK
jgi:CubicO group peptidase (beta-lactamase class C family)